MPPGAMAAVSELEREEMRLQAERLNDKLAASAARLSELLERTEQARRAFDAETAAHALRVDGYKRDDEQLRADALDVERRRAALRERQASEEAVLKADLAAARKQSAARAAEDDAVLAAQLAQLRLVESFEQAQADSQRISSSTQQAHERSAAVRAELERLDTAMPTLRAAGRAGRAAATAAPLVVLELLRVLPTRRQCQRDGWAALAALLATRPAEAPARLLTQAHAVGLVLTALRIHADHAEVITAAVGFAWKLAACDADAAAEALGAGALQAVVEALGRHVGGEASGAPAAAERPLATAATGASSSGLAASDARRARAVAQHLIYNCCGALRTLLGGAALAGRDEPAAVEAQRLGSARSTSRRRRSPAGGEGAPVSLPQIRRALGGGGGGGAGGEGGEGDEGGRARRARRLSTESMRRGSANNSRHGSADAARRGAQLGGADGGGGGGAAGSARGGSVPLRSQALWLLTCAMRVYPEKGSLQKSAIQLLHNLVQSDPRLVAECVRHGAIELIARAMRAHSLQAAVQQEALGALLCLSADARALGLLRALAPPLDDACDGAARNFAFNVEMVRMAQELKAALAVADEQPSALARGSGFSATPKSRQPPPRSPSPERGLGSSSAVLAAGAVSSFESELSALSSLGGQPRLLRSSSQMAAHTRQMRRPLSLAQISSSHERRPAHAQPARPFLLSARSPDAAWPDGRGAFADDVAAERDAEAAARNAAEPLGRSARTTLPFLSDARHAGAGGAALEAPQASARLVAAGAAGA